MTAIANIKMGIEGDYTLLIENTETGEKKKLGPFKNLITNSGMNALGENTTGWYAAFARCAVGSGNTPPNFSDTQLNSLVARSPDDLANRSSDSTWSNQGVSNRWSGFRVTYTFPVGAAAGNLSEVGVGNAGTNANYVLFSKALITDSNGVPITITVLPAEILTVVYNCRVYQNAADVTGTVDGYDFVLRPCDIGLQSSLNSANFNKQSGNNSTAYRGSIGAAEGSPTGTIVTASGGSLISGTYVNGSYTVTVRYRWTTTQGNSQAGGWNCVRFNTAGIYWQVQFTPYIMKDNTKQLDISINFTWARL